MTVEHLVYDYNLKINGVFGRNRTAKFKIERLARRLRDVEQPTEAELWTLVESKLSEIKLKTGKWVLTRAPVEIGGGFETFVLMSDVSLFRGEK